LPEYPKFADLKGDDRWKSITPRMLLSHSAGFPNFRFVNTDGKLDIKFTPGLRYAYSGEGINLLQLVIEEGLGLDVGKEMQRRVFDRFGMKHTSMTWRDEFISNLANGYNVEGKNKGHNARRSVRAAGSMDTTIEDYSMFMAAMLREEGLSSASFKQLFGKQIEIKSKHQFPTLESSEVYHHQQVMLAAGLGSVLFEGKQGIAFFKGGHDDQTDNFTIGLLAKKSGIVLLSNSSRGQMIFPGIVDSLLGDTGIPWSWEYRPSDSPK
jgi:CubicO group peptidase (beta-lactamase class C family)